MPYYRQISVKKINGNVTDLKNLTEEGMKIIPIVLYPILFQNP